MSKDYKLIVTAKEIKMISNHKKNAQFHWQIEELQAKRSYQ